MSWENVSKWYDTLVGEKGQYYHQEVILPGVLRLMGNPTSVLDLACGQGILARRLPKTAAYLGIDVSPSLINAAKGYRLGKNREFLTHDLSKPLSLKKKDFSHACVILALQNFADPKEVLHTAFNHLAQEGSLLIVLNHPCFRIPRQTSWGVDEKNKRQYRRLDRYLSPLEIPIVARPGADPKEKTVSFHFPLSYYINCLSEAGFCTTHMEEWISNKKSTGSKAKMEDRAREEIPLFLTIAAKKKAVGMCGIYGYIGPKNSAEVCLEGLKSLEYRGYDSAGIVGGSNGILVGCKEVGKIAVLEKTLTEKPLKLDAAIAHTRWATHGKPSQENAHPHYDGESSLAIVHNGIIENHFELKEMLKEKGYTFTSETDTEVIAHLISFFNEGDLLSAFYQALALMKGFWALCLVHKDHPDKIIAAAKESSLCIGQSHCRGEAYIASDPNAFHGKELDVTFLQTGEIAVVTAKELKVYDASFTPVQTSSKRFNLEAHAISKENYPHFMLKEIMEQPQTIQQALHNRMIDAFGTAEFETLPFSAQELLNIKRITIIACGTSWHAGCVAASLLEKMARIPAQAEIASEFRYKNPIISENTLVLAISQSGETLDTLAAVREVKSKGAKVLGICNVAHSTLTRVADGCLLLRAGPEISVCSTKAFTSQLTVLSLFTLLMARLGPMGKEEGQRFLEELRRLPETVAKVLEQREKIQELAKKYSNYGHFFFLGRHYMYASALEAALKLKEITYLWATGYPAGEMKHGPIALINEKLPVIGLLGNRATYEKILSNLHESKSRGAPILAFAPEGAEQLEKVADDILFLPPISDELAPIPYSVACQLFAYEMASLLGCEIDTPRNLAKSVTVE